MDLFEDPHFKLKYQKSKYTVKVWESEFRKLTGHNPTKLDIKSATPYVREAYKAYYKLKTRVLEDLDITFPDNSKNGFLDEKAEPKTLDANTLVEYTDKNKHGRIVLADIQNGKETIGNADDSTAKKAEPKTPDANSRIVLGDIQNGKETIGNTDDLTTKKTCVLKDDDRQLSDSVWGEHLNRDNEKVNQKPKSFTRSLSFSFTEKLLVGAKFNTRNPRKSLSLKFSRKMNKSNGSLSQENVNIDEIGSLSLPLPSQATVQPESEGKRLPNTQSTSHFGDDKYKLITNRLSVNNQAVSAIQKALMSGGQKMTPSRKIDRGWLERCTQSHTVNENNFKRSTSLDESVKPDTPARCISPDAKRSDINLNREKNVNENKVSQKSTVLNRYKKSIDSDEDVIYSSDSESDTKLKPKTGERNFKVKRKFNSVESKTIGEPVIVTQPAKKSRLITATSQLSVESNGSNIVKELTQIDVNKIADAIVGREKDIVAKKFKSGKKVPQKLTKKEILEKKVASGEANENFVKLNLKKKVYVRGKKTMTFSKHQKAEWKKRKALGSGNGNRRSYGSLMTCFSCGDVGHFSRNCTNPKGDKLMPQNDDDDEEEDPSPYPTLEEVALMAAEPTHLVMRKTLSQEVQVNSVHNKPESNKVSGSSIPSYVLDILNENKPESKVVEPLYPLNTDGTLIDTPAEVYEALERFGHDGFRPGQEEAVMRILSGLSTLLTLSTGSGKSLCYQLSAYLLSQRSSCITLVVSPLVSLMEDQVTGVASCLQAACLHTNQSPKQREKVMELAKQGKLNVLLVSPEAIVSGDRNKGFGSIINELPPIGFACIDEVHCVSQWSHNFRPSYLMICKVLRDKLGVKTVLGLTATATKATCTSIVQHLAIPDGERGVIKDIPLPDNLLLSVSKDKLRDQALLILLKGQRFDSCDSIIIYCTRREECQRLAVLIRTWLQDTKKPQENKPNQRISWNAEPYHAGLSAARRKLVQKTFMSGQLRIVVATVAFGMGINKQDIRGVIHYNMPRNFESYVQEVGRAGRDGQPAHCHLFLDSEGNDQNELRRHIYANSVERHTIRKLLQRIFVPCRCVKGTGGLQESELDEEKTDEFVAKQHTIQSDEGNTSAQECDKSSVKCGGHEVAFIVEETVRALDLPEENISTMLCYLELHPKSWIKILSPVYTMCKLQSYKGPKTLKAAAKKSPPLAMAIALDQRRGISHEKSNKIEFPVVDIAAALDWSSGIVKRQLKNLEWQNVDGRWKKTGLVVELSCLGFHVEAPGDLSSSELDEALDSLHERVESQEQTSLQQLQAVFKALTSVAYSTCLECSEGSEVTRSDKLKSMIREYFNQDNFNIELESQSCLANEEQITADVRQLICGYRDTNFTGRAVARIFHGIGSPCYPALVWWRCRFWRAHLQTDFKLISKVASREILRLR